MDLINSLAIGLPVFIILLGPLMFIHELGHFWGAKKAGIRVEEFGMGFPPRALTIAKRGETTYSLNWLPIGAFVRMTGEDGAAVSDPRSFGAASKKWRLITLFAGPFMNFIGAFVILTAAYLFFATTPSEFRYRITQVQPGKAAEQLGILPGDVVVSANGVDLTQFASDHGQGMSGVQVTPLKKQSQASIGKPFTIVVERPTNPEDAKSPVGRVELQGQIPADASFDTPLGVGIGAKVLKTERVIYSVPGAVIEAASDMGNVVAGMVMAPSHVA